MKKVLLTIISVCLIAASIFGLFAGVSSFSDIMNVKEYKEKDAKEGLESIDTLDAGLDQLQENEGTYLAGVDTYTAGLVSYSEGKSTLSAGYAAYYAGKKQLEEGKAAYAAGKKQIEDNTAAYNEGKATLAKIEPLMPYVDQYVKFRNGTISNLAGFSSAHAWFVSVVRPIAAASKGLVIPDDVTDLPAYVQQMVADGKAQLKQYEDGLAQLAEAEKTIAAGEAQLKDAEKQLAQGEVDLAAGGNKLADGKKQLNTFEDGCAQVAAGCELLMSQPAYMNDEGNGDKKMCPSVADILKERYGDNFSIWELDDNGEIRVVNGCQYLNLENCRAVGQAGRDYISVYQTAAVTKEVMSRLGVVAAMLIASVLGLIAGLFGILSVIRISKGKIVTASVCGIISAVIAAAGNVIGMLTGYTGYTLTYPHGAQPQPVLQPTSSRVTPSSSRSSFWPSLRSCLRSSRVSSPALISVRRKPLPIRPPLLPLPWPLRSLSRSPLPPRTTRPLSKPQHQQKISGV